MSILLLLSLFLFKIESAAQFVRGPTAATWVDAARYCADLGHTLASIDSQDENDDAVAACIAGRDCSGSNYCPCWLGLSTTTGDSTGWTWLFQQPMSYGEPIASACGDPPWISSPGSCDGLPNDHCAVIQRTSPSGGWDDRSCSSQFYPLCRVCSDVSTTFSGECSHSSNCCDNLGCEFDDLQNGRCCIMTNDEDIPCSDNDECCTGLLCDLEMNPSVCRECLSIGNGCSSGCDCCDSSICFSDYTCQSCVQQGSSGCSVDSDCCNDGVCHNGQCYERNACYEAGNEIGQFCQCHDHCKGNECKAKKGGGHLCAGNDVCCCGDGCAASNALFYDNHGLETINVEYELSKGTQIFLVLLFGIILVFISFFCITFKNNEKQQAKVYK